MYLFMIHVSSGTVTAAKHDALPPIISAKSTDQKGNGSKLSKWNNLSKAKM